MPRKLPIDEFLRAAESGGIVMDVRSPGEFQRGHIPGARNLPLFSVEERAQVGTCYKQKGRDEAVMLGLEIVGPKMRQLAEQARTMLGTDVPQPSQVLLHCWRGGMRSSSLAWLLEQIGLEPLLLEGGYKSYRRAAHAAFEVERNLIVLSGMTGAGKTRMLSKLRNAGEQVLDLEGIAHHRGSSFGAIGLPAQPTCEQFENLVYAQLRTYDPSRPVWVEDESPSIGRVRVPTTFWNEMRASPAIFLVAERDVRATHLAEEYGSLPVDDLADAVQRLERKLGGLRTQEVLADLKLGNMYEVAFRLLEYYDKSYKHAGTRRPRKHIYRIDGSSSVEQLIECSRQQVENCS